ncbi:MAG: fimbrillin family protein [Bacteroidales bacterium]|nr:fimbrillin family protein [Bacteroidales bacterium]
MKTNQLILAAALVALAASCNKEEFTTPGATLDNEIGFTAVTKKATKANDAIISGATYAHDNTFNVWGWQSQEGDFSEFAADAASNFMSNLTIEWTKGRDNTRAEDWRNADNYYYWPFTGKISFLAIHPSTVAPTSTGWDATNKKPQATIENYTVVGKDSTDLMFANAAGSRRADALPIVFSHALSQIQFRVRTDYDYTQDGVVFKVDSVKLNNIDLTGNVAYENDVITWSENDTQTVSKDYYKQSDTVHYAASDAAAALYGRALVMIPQPANADDPATAGVLEGTTITIGYTMKQKDYAAISGTVTVAAPWTKVKEGATDYDPAEAIAAWEPGKKYMYTLNFKLNEILFDPTVTDWVVVEMSTINILD